MIERTMSEGILTLQLTHGKANALDLELLDALLREFDATTDEVRAVVLTGTGSIFSAGVDLFRLTREGADYVRVFLPLLSRFLRALFAFPKPVVAAVNGHAIAGGCMIVLASDARLMADGDGTIGVPELLVGVPFPTAPLELVRFAVPKDKIQTLIYSGRTLRPRDAVAAGLIDEVVAPDDLMPRAAQVARQLAAIPAETYHLTKQCLRAPTLLRIDQAGEHDQLAMKVWASPDTHAHIREYLSATLRK